MHLRDLSLRAKQGVAFGLILLMMGLVHAYSINRMADIKEDIDRIDRSWLPRAIAISETNLSTAELRTSQLQHALASTEEEKQDQADRMIDLIDRINANLDLYEELIVAADRQSLLADREQTLYAAFDTKWDTYQDLFLSFVKLSLENRRLEAMELLNGEMRLVFEEFSLDLAELVEINKQNTVEAARRAEQTLRATHFFTTALLLVTIVLLALMSLSMARFIVVPVQQLEKAAHSVAQGEIDVQLEVESRDEIGSLARSFNQMTAALRAQQAELRQTNATLEQKNADLEQALVQLQEAQQQLIMQEKMASLGNLVAGVAHEINNPIGAISSAAQTSARSLEIITAALEREEGQQLLGSEPKLSRALQALCRNNEVAVMASERIGKIVRSLRTFARLDQAEFQRIDLHEGLDSTLTLLDHLLKNRIEVVRDYGEIPPLDCYPDQLNQVFMNILTNAAQAIEGPGRITLRTFRQADEVRVTITDTGVGIPPADRERIFDPGFTSKGVGVGTGLGLSISYNIIQRHQGRFEVDSEQGKGTTMTIILPLGLPEPPALPQ
jgi:signal transduction histidine kinase